MDKEESWRPAADAGAGPGANLPAHTTACGYMVPVTVWVWDVLGRRPFEDTAHAIRTSHPSTHWDVEVTAKGSAKFLAACSDTANVRLVPGIDFKRKEKQETPNKVFFGGNSGNAAAWMVFAAPPLALVSASGDVAHTHQVGGRCGAQWKANDGLFQSMDFGQKGWECGRAIHWYVSCEVPKNLGSKACTNGCSENCQRAGAELCVGQLQPWQSGRLAWGNFSLGSRAP